MTPKMKSQNPNYGRYQGKPARATGQKRLRSQILVEKHDHPQLSNSQASVIAKQEIRKEEKQKKAKPKSFDSQFEEKFGKINKEEKTYGRESRRVETDDGAEYIIYDDYKDAELDAIDSVKEIDENGDGSSYNKDFADNYRYISDMDKQFIAQDLADGDVDNMDDDEILEATENKEKYDDLENKSSELTAKDASPEEIKKIETEMENLVDSSKEELRDDKYDEHLAGLEKDPEGYLVDDLGLYSREDYYKQSFVQFDSDEAAEASVRTDGVGHTLAGYDGDETELDGKYIYRTN